MMSRLKKLNRSLDICDRDYALCYIDGELIESNTHAGCINKYLEQKIQESLINGFGRPTVFDDYYVPGKTQLSDDALKDTQLIKDNIKQMAFAHIIKDDNGIFIEPDTLYNVDLDTVVNAIKSKYPTFDIYKDDQNDDYPKIARLKKKKMKKTANYVTNDFDSFFLGSGDVIAIGCRLVNNKPRYQVYQEGLYTTSSYYDGDDYDKALQMYKDLMTAFNGVGKTEGFAESEVKIKENIDLLINEKKDDEYNFDKLKSDPLFLGVNRNDW